MKLRIGSTVLWFLAGWAAVGEIAFRLGFNPAAGLFVGIMWASFVALDPKHLMWRRGTESHDRLPRPRSPQATQG